MAQQAKNPVYSSWRYTFDPRPLSVGQASSVASFCKIGSRSDVAVASAAAPIRPLAQKLPYATGTTVKKKKFNAAENEKKIGTYQDFEEFYF